MHTPVSLRKLQESVLEKIGSNILLFQRVEISLKHIAPLTDLRKAKHALDHLLPRHQWFQGKPLGTLVSSLKLGLTDEANQELVAALDRMVTNRNRLVHTCLGDGTLKLSTVEECRASIEWLELQAKEAGSIIAVVNTLLVGFMKAALDTTFKGTDEYDEFFLLFHQLRARLTPGITITVTDDDSLH